MALTRETINNYGDAMNLASPFSNL